MKFVYERFLDFLVFFIFLPAQFSGNKCVAVIFVLINFNIVPLRMIKFDFVKV